MKTRAIAVAVAGGALLVGCASIVGITDLGPDGGAGTGSGSGSSSGTVSGSGSGSSSGVITGSSSGVSGSSSGVSGSSSGVTTGSSSGSSSSGGANCAVPAGATCAVDPQCGCSAGQKCDIAAGVPGCTSAGTSGSGTDCTANTDCAAGLTCASGVCRPFCTAAQVGGACPAATSGPALGACFQDANSAGAAIPQDTLCLFQCTPDPSSCSAGQGCVLLHNAADTIAYTDCELAGTGVPGSACTNINDCVAGSMCYQAGGVCAQFCRTTADCANLGNTCDTTTVFVTIGGVTYGFCD